VRLSRLVIATFATACLLAGSGVLAVSSPASAAGSGSGVLISQLRTRSASSQYDEYIQITNATSAPVDVSGWQLYDCYQSGGTQELGTDGNPLPAGTTLPAGATFVFGKDEGDYTGVSDATYGFQVTETGGWQLQNASGQVQDSVGAPGSRCARGTGLTFPTSGSDFVFTRKAGAGGGLQDTGDNAADFSGPSGDADGTPCGTPCAAPPTPTAIDQIQGTGATSPKLGDRVQITGTAIGVDNQQDVSNYVDIDPRSAGIYVETPTADWDSNAQTSEGIFVGDLPAPERTASHIGQTVTVSGTVTSLYGLTTVDAAGYTPAFTGKAKAASLPAPVTIDPAQAAAQTVSSDGYRPYYQSLQSMRVALQVGTANSGGTDKFGELFVTPGTQRKLNLAGYGTPIGPPQLLDIAQDAGSAGVDPANTDATPDSTTRVNANLFDTVKNVIGPLGFDFDNYEIVPQPGLAPKVSHTGVSYPPKAPAAKPGTLRIANFNMENMFGVGMTDDGHTYTKAEVNQKTTRLANAIRLMHRPDVIADEEIASPDAYREVASRLVGYQVVWVPSNDERHIAVGFLVRNRIKITSVQQLGKTATTTLTGCNDDPADDPQLFERPPLAISIDDHGLKLTLIGNHWASQGHPESCRNAQADFVNGQVKSMEAAGRHVVVLGDLNDYQDAPALTGDLISGTTLQDLWFRAPAKDAYSYQYDGQLETLDHIFTDQYLSARVKKIRYVHFDNDYFPRNSASSPVEVSDHDPPVAVLRLPKH
jgi:predicted extracellular nuclease